MKYKLINPINKNYTALETILTNRHIPYAEIEHYLNTTDNDINDFNAFGQNCLREAAAAAISCINDNKEAVVIVDCDCDGFTASALLINYLHDIFPTWVENKLHWWVHEGKQHGLQDAMEYIESHHFSLVIAPDSSSNDYDQHMELLAQGIKTIILDHHLADHVSDYAITINNQLCDYPNKELSGVGVVWQFCRYLDSLLNVHHADQYLDLVALGLR